MEQLLNCITYITGQFHLALLNRITWCYWAVSLGVIERYLTVSPGITEPCLVGTKPSHYVATNSYKSVQNTALLCPQLWRMKTLRRHFGLLGLSVHTSVHQSIHGTNCVYGQERLEIGSWNLICGISMKNKRTSIFFRTCFSMGDLGVQVSVHPSVCPSVNIYHWCLVSATPLTVFYWSFWNFADVFFMVWGCACGLDIIVGLFFITFSTLWT